jgi:hypothetical protein
MKKLRVGKVYHIIFLDHCMHSGADAGLIKCHVYGLLGNETSKSIDIHTWQPDQIEDEVNVEKFSILKSAIIKAKELK